MNIYYFGYFGGLMSSLCSLPQVIKIVKDGNARGTSLAFLLIWLIGNLSMQVYVFGTRGFDKPVFFSYWLNCFFVAIMLKYKLKPRT